MKVKDVDDVEQNWQEKVRDIGKIMALPSPSVCSRYVMVHFVKNVRTDERTRIPPASTPFNYVKNKKTEFRGEKINVAEINVILNCRRGRRTKLSRSGD